MVITTITGYCSHKYKHFNAKMTVEIHTRREKIDAKSRPLTHFLRKHSLADNFVGTIICSYMRLKRLAL